MYEPFGGAALGIDVDAIRYDGSFWNYNRTTAKSCKRDVVKVVVRKSRSEIERRNVATEGAFHLKRLALRLSERANIEFGWVLSSC